MDEPSWPEVVEKVFYWQAFPPIIKETGMKSRILWLGALASLLLAFASPVHAALITSKSDPALFGATIIDFEGLPLGTQPVFFLPGGSIFNGLSILGNDFSVYGMSGRTLSNLDTSGETSPSAINIAFETPVSAFGILAGAIQRGITYTALDSAGAVLGTVPFSSFPSAPVTGGFLGIQADGIKFAILTLTGPDKGIFDDLHFAPEVAAPIPEPSTLLLMGSGHLIMGGYVWRRERVKQV